jgi:nitrous oxidase accessory protein NosD
MTVSSANETYLENQSINPMTLGNILYVGGIGPGNYTRIQDAIDNASDGDTVYVYDDSSPYNENLIVDKSITLKGENKETTVINGNESEIVIDISSDNVILSGFTILNSGIGIIYTEYTTISDNIITSTNSGGWAGIIISEGKNNNISRNLINNFEYGILFLYSNNYSIYGNTITNNWWGIFTSGFSINDVISLNNITGNFYGIRARNCFNYKITKNNFIGNYYKNAGFGYVLFKLFEIGFKYKSIGDIRSTIKWDGNYWNRPRSVPKLIYGQLPPMENIPWFQFDRNPASEPYDIGI